DPVQGRVDGMLGPAGHDGPLDLPQPGSYVGRHRAPQVGAITLGSLLPADLRPGPPRHAPAQRGPRQPARPRLMCVRTHITDNSHLLCACARTDLPPVTRATVAAPVMCVRTHITARTGLRWTGGAGVLSRVLGWG